MDYICTAAAIAIFTLATSLWLNPPAHGAPLAAPALEMVLPQS